MDLSLSHTLRLFNIFREFDGKENCAQVLEEECFKMLGTKSLNDEHDFNVVSINSLNIHSTNDDCSSHDENISYEHVNFCGVHVCMNTPKREDIYCKRHKHLETKWLHERLGVSADCFMIKSCPKIVMILLSIAHYNELSLLLGYE